MDRKNIFVCGVSAVAILLTIAGCQTPPTITADCIMPPRAISDIKGIDTMEIVVNVSMPGNKDAEDESIAKGIICETLAAGFTKEGFYRTTDFVWGEPQGAAKMFSEVSAQKSRHGYARFATDPVRPRAKMELNFNMQVESGENDLDVETGLSTVYYKTKYMTREIRWGRDPNRQNKEKIQIPYSVPDRKVKSVAYSKVKQFWISAIGSVDVKLTDKNGKVVYQQSFSNLRATSKCDHKSLNAPLSKASLFSQIAQSAASIIVKDVSPYRESKVIKINKDGDERGFLLLNALAFSEAFDVFENIKEEERTFADWENLGVICEALGDYENAKKCFETAINVKDKDKGFFDYDERIAENGIVRIEKVINAQKKLEKIK